MSDAELEVIKMGTYYYDSYSVDELRRELEIPYAHEAFL